MSVTICQSMGFVVSALGIGGIIASTCMDQWSTQDLYNNPVTAVFNYQGLWRTCVRESSGFTECRGYFTILGLPGRACWLQEQRGGRAEPLAHARSCAWVVVMGDFPCRVGSPNSSQNGPWVLILFGWQVPWRYLNPKPLPWPSWGSAKLITADYASGSCGIVQAIHLGQCLLCGVISPPCHWQLGYTLLPQLHGCAWLPTRNH